MFYYVYYFPLEDLEIWILANQFEWPLLSGYFSHCFKYNHKLELVKKLQGE